MVCGVFDVTRRLKTPGDWRVTAERPPVARLRESDSLNLGDNDNDISTACCTATYDHHATNGNPSCRLEPPQSEQRPSCG